jgi:phospholipid N-methyltransferase
VQSICKSQGIEHVDMIISGLPWASFPDELQIATLEGVRNVLKPGGRLVTFGYHIGTMLPAGRRFYRRLPEYFSRITRSPYIWLNLPPAFVITCFP